MTGWIALEIPSTDKAPSVARQFLRDHADELADDLVDDALILISELVTNALRYGRPAITVRLRADPPGLGVAVRDHGESMPVLPSSLPDADRQSGRGLLIVDAISHAWGIDGVDDPPGKTVWFELVPSTV